jgi:hypothetical protein
VSSKLVAIQSDRLLSAKTNFLAVLEERPVHQKRPNMEKLSLPALAAEFQSMVERLDVEPYYAAFHTSPQHDGAPHVEMRWGKFEFVVTERGSEIQRISGLHTDDVLYLLFEGITLSMATSYELRRRKPSGDSRAVWFPYQEELMARLKPAWGAD